MYHQHFSRAQQMRKRASLNTLLNYSEYPRAFQGA